MKRWIAILLLSTYACSATELHQLFKVPALLSHFAEHAQENPEESFLCFLMDHYLGGDHHDATETDGHELPFHCQHDCVGHVLQVAVPFAVDPLVIAVDPVPTEFPLATDASYSFLLSRDVWQPPKA